MKRLFILIWVLAAWSASAQISKLEYFWDTDPGFGLGNPITIYGDSVNGVYHVSTLGLQPGLHTLYIRCQDDSARWSVFSKKVIQINEPVYSITQAEYFYDTDPGFGNATNIPISAGDSVELTKNFPTNSLAPGLHTLYVRTKDASGKWSVYSKRLIHIQQPVYQIEEAEYFVDTDPGFGNGTPITVTPGDSIDLTPNINTDSLAPGLHTVYIRVKTTNNEWSVFSKRMIHIQYPEAPEIVAAEYFVDTDPGFGNATAIPLTAGDSVLVNNFQVPTDSLSLGIHMLHVRVKDNNGQWSVFSKKLIYIDNPADDPVVAAEYFIDTDPGVGNGTPISITAGDSIAQNFSAPTDSLLIGPHWIHVRVQDAEGRWSVYSRDSFYVDNFNCLIYGNGEIELLGDTCRGTQITFKDKTTSNSGVNSADYSYEWDFFNDGSVDFNDSTVNYTFNQTGTDTVVLKVYETLNPICQETVTKIFTIRRIDTTYSSEQICDGDSILIGNVFQKDAGTYYTTYNNRYGCDSVHVTSLTVIGNVTPSVTISGDDSICSGAYTVFTATPVNGGYPLYTWKVNNVAVGSGYGPWYQYGFTTLNDGDVITCEITSSETCTTVNPVSSNGITVHVTPSVPPTVTIAVDTNNFCFGTTATVSVINATGTGNNPRYDWYLNNNFMAQSGSGTTFTRNDFVNGNFITCYLYSDEVCATSTLVVSNVIYMNVSQTAYPEVSVYANTNSVCYRTPITFTTSTGFGGNNPNYEWFLNGSSVQNGSSNTYANDSLDDNDEIKCVLTSDYECRLADTDTSNTFVMDIIYALPVSVTLSPGGNNVCEGTGVTFYASAINGGNPSYQFFVNGNSVQNSSLYYYSYTPANDDSVWVVVTSDILCATNNPATSDKIHMSVIEYDTVSVSITATVDTICAGEEIIFTANAVNAGAAPNYLWRVNNIQYQYGAADTFTISSLGNGSIVRCDLYGDHQCTTPVPAVSNNIQITVNDTLRPQAVLSIPQTTICKGTQVDFDVTLTNEGANPTIEWLINNNVVQNGGLSYSSSTLQNLDAVRVRLTVDYVCPLQNPVLSNAVVMTVIDSITPSVFVYHGPNPACPGNLVSVFTTTSTGGNAPMYDFHVNGILKQSGANSQYNSNSFADGDVVQVIMTSNAACLRTDTALSNADTIRVNQFIPANVSIQATVLASCIGELSTFQATPVNGGVNPLYTWKVNNAVFQSSASNIFNTTALQNGDSVYCQMTSYQSCATNNPAKSNTLYISLQSCALCDTVDCNDNNACTTDSCSNGICFNTTIACNDNNLCTIDRCDNGNCEHADIVCADSNLCTIDFCSNGDCVFQPLDCNDNNACTSDLCDLLTGECVRTAIACVQDADSCTIEICDVVLGCISVAKNCSDGDLCTQDLCQDNHCVNPPVVCNPVDACNTVACVNGQCIQTPKVCDDDNVCTTNGCDIISGCVFTQVSCNDASACTFDSCNTQTGCFHTAVICNDSLVCTVDVCDSSFGCIFPAINCDDSNPCTDDFCDTLGVCNNDTIMGCENPCDTLVCNDNDLCTADACLNGACAFTVISCSDNNLCTTNDCAPLSGCVFTAIFCDDGDLCTIDDCAILYGCIFTPNQNCVNPCDTLNCSDGNPCTSDNCFNGQCTHAYNIPVCSPEHDAICQTEVGRKTYVNGIYIAGESTLSEEYEFTDPDDVVLSCSGTLFNDTDSNQNCDWQVDVYFMQNRCDDANVCTDDDCSSPFGCENLPITCNDNNACTSDDCNALTGCTFTPISCNDNNPCTDDFCDTLGLCNNDSIPNCGNPCDTLVCADNDLCTADACVNGQCAHVYNLPVSVTTAPEHDGCQTYEGMQVFVNGAYIASESTLPENFQLLPDDVVLTLSDVLFNDTDSLNSCDVAVNHILRAVTCDDNNPCTDDECSGVCFNFPIVCDDSSTCTSDACFNGACVFTPIICNDNNLCTSDGCDSATGCVFTAVVCDDADLCTADACFVQSGCDFSPVSCDDNNLCTLDSCAAQSGCFYTAVDCNDNDACTDDSCEPLSGCLHIAHNCDDNSLCTLDNCEISTGCVYTAVLCDDNDLCTADTCFAQSGCVFTPVNCNDGDSCTIDKCEFGVCVNAPITCFDGDFCTRDTCISGTCFFIPVVCADNDACTDEFCSPASGCLFPARDCNDGNACTNDFCNAAFGCYTTQVNCDDGNACTSDYCELIFGCTYSPVFCDDSSLCTIDVCDALTGCSFTPINCDDGEPCTFDFCDNGSCQHVCDENSSHELVWHKSLGGTSADGARSIHQTADGGYVVTGYAFSNNGDVSGNHGQSDFWVTRLDAGGNLLWQKALGGGKSESAASVKQTADGGYILAGNTKSNDGNVSGNHGGEDFWVVKLDGSGNLDWQKTLGGDNADIASALEQTTDGGYVVAGWTSSNAGDVSGNHGASDYWVVKLDANGNLLWQKALGGSSSEQANAVQQTTDGGYIVAGNTKSNNGNVSGNHGASDFWVVKLDASGNLSWQKTLGGSSSESAHAVKQTSDGGFVVAGSAQSSNGDVSGNNGGADYWVVKLDGSGNLVWEKNFGGSANDVAQSVGITADGGFVIAGGSKSNNMDVSGNHGNDDFWVVRLDAAGNSEWQQSLGGGKKDYAYSAQQTTDEGFVIAGYADSHNTGDVRAHRGSSDFWVVKLAPNRVCRPLTELSQAICAGDSTLFGNDYLKTSGVYSDTLLNRFGCDSIVTLTLTVAYCDDGDPCTVDICENGVCSYVPLICEDGDVCTLDDCDAQHNGCFFTAIVCNDNNSCTSDECHFGACVYSPIVCDDNNACTLDECVNGVCLFTDAREVVSFTLVNAATDFDLGILNDGDTINLAVTPLVNIRADVCATSNIESVKFLLNGSFHKMENIPFYTIAGDNGGNYNPWTIAPGVYTIRAIPYNGNNGAGITGIAHEITIVIVDGLPEPCEISDIKVASFTLINANTDADIGPLTDGAVLNLSVTGPINVRANVHCGELIGSVKFKLNGSSFRTEGTAPYSLAGDNPSGNYHPWNVQPGVYTILATPYSGANGTGIVGTPLSITITIVGSAAKMDGEEQFASATGETINLSAYPNPFSEKVNIFFSVSYSERVQIDIVSVEGRVIATVFNGTAKENEEHRVEFHSGNLSSGMYFYRMITESGLIENRKLLLVR